MITISASGDKANASGFSLKAARTSRLAEIIVNIQASHFLRLPLGIARIAVLGLPASISASAIRLKDMAQLRAPTIATIIQLILSSLGIPLEAKNVLITAKGNAKIVCPNLIIPRMIWIFRITINLLAFAWAWIVNPMISGISASADDSVSVPTMIGLNLWGSKAHGQSAPSAVGQIGIRSVQYQIGM